MAAFAQTVGAEICRDALVATHYNEKSDTQLLATFHKHPSLHVAKHCWTSEVRSKVDFSNW